MQRLTLVLAAAVALMFGQASHAFAADAKAAVPPPISKDQITTGMKEAPAIVQAVGAPCTLTSAAYLGPAPQKDAQGKAYTSKVYEVACQEGLGYILMTKAPGEKPQVYDCVMTKTSSVKCNLPANANPDPGLQKTVTAAGLDCTVNNARYVGSMGAQGLNLYEVGCTRGVAYVIEAPAVGSSAKSVTMSCIQAEAAKMDCQFMPKEARISYIANLAVSAPNAKDCKVNQVRFVGATQGVDYYELGCDAGKPGLMIEIGAGDKLVKDLSCAQADGIAGGCQFPTVNTAETAENGTYTKLANAAGLPCTVDKYRFLAIDPTTKAEMVELSCSNRPAGAVAYFSPGAGVKTRIYDCLRASGRGITCKLSTLNQVYPGLTQALVSKGKTTCQVSNARVIGTAGDSEFVEAACSDGLPGWVVEYDANSPDVKSVIACGAAKGIGGGCTLPGNVLQAAKK